MVQRHLEYNRVALIVALVQSPLEVSKVLGHVQQDSGSRLQAALVHSQVRFNKH